MSYRRIMPLAPNRPFRLQYPHHALKGVFMKENAYIHAILADVAIHVRTKIWNKVCRFNPPVIRP
jgi:hypothetical protein